MFRTPEHCLYICAVKYVKEPLLCNWLVLSGVTLKLSVCLSVSHQHVCAAYLGRADCCILTPGWDVNRVLCSQNAHWCGNGGGPFITSLTRRLIKDICFLRNLTLLIAPRDVFITKVHGLQGSASVLSWVHAFVFECLMSVRSLLSSKERTQIPQIRP